MTTRLRMGRLGPLLVLAIGLAALPACDNDRSAEPDELSGWNRSNVYGHRDVVDYDHVAVASDGRHIAWLTRARGLTDALGIAEWPASNDVKQGDLPMPGGVDGERMVPSAMAVSDNGWTAVASLNEKGKPPALAAWSGFSDQPSEHARLELPEGRVVSRTVVAARSRTVAVVLALTGTAQPASKGIPEPTSVAVWTTPIDLNGVVDSRGWKLQPVGFATDGPFVTVAIAGAGDDGLVLAGVTSKRTPSVWASTNGQAWKEIQADLPAKVDAVDLVTPLGDGDALIAWSTGGLGRTEELWRLDGTRLVSTGTVAGPDDGTIDLTSAVAVGDQLVIGGSIVRRDTWIPMLWAYADDEWRATDQPELVGGYDWSIEALAAHGTDRVTAVMVSTPSHIDIATWTWRRDSPE